MKANTDKRLSDLEQRANPTLGRVIVFYPEGRPGPVQVLDLSTGEIMPALPDDTRRILKTLIGVSAEAL